MPRRSTPHAIVDYTNDDPTLHDSNLVDDDHYISLQLHSDLDYNDYEDETFDPSRRNTPLTGVQQLDVSSAYNLTSHFTDRHQMSSEYERFDIRAPIWGPNKRESIILSASGALSIIAGLLCCMCGVFDFIVESYAGSAAFQVESKFGMLVIVFGGLASCKAASRLKATSLACLLGFSLMGVAAGLCDAIMQCLNLYYVAEPLERGIDVAILIFSGVGALSSLVQVSVALVITANAIERQAINDNSSSAPATKQRQAALVLGVVQGVCGVVIAGLTVGMYAVLESDTVVVTELKPGRNNSTNTTSKLKDEKSVWNFVCSRQ